MIEELRNIHDVSFKHLNSDPVEGILSCGFLPKTQEVKIHNFSYYGGFLILSGSGSYTDINGVEREIGVGDFVQRQPGVKHTTKVYQGQPWLEFYVCFGRKIYETLTEINLISKEPIIHIKLNKEVLKRCEILLYEYKTTSEKDKSQLLLATQSFIFYINELSEEAGRLDVTKQMIEDICERLATDFEEKIEIRELAKRYQIGYESLRKLFKKNVGTSIYHYRVMKRINEVKRLLCYPEMTLKQIADQVGFTDQYALSNQFKKITGMSPKAFRQQL